MSSDTVPALSYVAFAGFVILHTFEEIACGILSERIGNIALTPRRYLRAASGIATANALTSASTVSGAPAGCCLGLATAAVFGVFQAMELMSSGAEQKESPLHRLRRRRKEIAAEQRNPIETIRILKNAAGKGIAGFLSRRLAALWSGNRPSAEQDPETAEA